MFCFPHTYVTFQLPGEVTEGLIGTTPNCKMDSFTMYVDSVSVIMATCPCSREPIDSKWHKTTLLLFQFLVIQKTIASFQAPPQLFVTYCTKNGERAWMI